MTSIIHLRSPLSGLDALLILILNHKSFILKCFLVDCFYRSCSFPSTLYIFFLFACYFYLLVNCSMIQKFSHDCRLKGKPKV